MNILLVLFAVWGFLLMFCLGHFYGWSGGERLESFISAFVSSSAVVAIVTMLYVGSGRTV